MNSSAETTDDPALWAFFQKWQQLDKLARHQSVDLNAYNLLLDTLKRGVAVGTTPDAVLALCRGLFLKPHHNRLAFEKLFWEMWNVAPINTTSSTTSVRPSSTGTNPEIVDQNLLPEMANPVSEENRKEQDNLGGNQATEKPNDLPNQQSDTTMTKVAVRFSSLIGTDATETQPNHWETEAQTQAFKIEGNYEPLEERSMRQYVRQLRQQTYRNAPRLPDLSATIDRITEQGSFDGIVHKRIFQYEVPLTLLVDRRGSMMPFHHLCDQFIEAVLEQAGTSVRYFQNVFDTFLFRTPFLTNPQLFTEWIHTLDPNTLLIILSDAGSARGSYNPKRIDQMKAMIDMIQEQHRFRMVWLNPMPRNRWWASSAMSLTGHIPMFTFDDVEIGAVVKTLNGQILSLP